MAAKLIFTPEQEAFIKANCNSMPTRHIAKQLKLWPSSVRSYMQRNGLTVSKESMQQFRELSYYKPGHKNPNKGKKQYEFMKPEAIAALKPNLFKTGQIPANALHDHAITIRKAKTGKFYKFIRTAPGKWLHLHLYNWQQAGKKVPAGYVVTMKDGNTLNPDISNLELISRAENLARNSKEFKLLMKEKNIGVSNIKRATKIYKTLKKSKAKKETKLRIRQQENARENERKQQRLAIATQKNEARRKKELEKKPKFNTRSIDYSQMTSIRIDAKTTIYAKPGEDPEEVRKRYLNRRILSNHLSTAAIKI